MGTRYSNSPSRCRAASASNLWRAVFEPLIRRPFHRSRRLVRAIEVRLAVSDNMANSVPVRFNRDQSCAVDVTSVFRLKASD
jgi:hypothetical protein